MVLSQSRSVVAFVVAQTLFLVYRAIIGVSMERIWFIHVKSNVDNRLSRSFDLRSGNFVDCALLDCILSVTCCLHKRRCKDEQTDFVVDCLTYRSESRSNTSMRPLAVGSIEKLNEVMRSVDLCAGVTPNLVVSLFREREDGSVGFLSYCLPRTCELGLKRNGEGILMRSKA